MNERFVSRRDEVLRTETISDRLGRGERPAGLVGEPGGRADVWSATLERYALLSTLPRIAIPSAPPSSRDTSLIADATPCFSRGSEATMAVVAGAPARAIPAPNGITPTRKCQ